MGYYCAWGDAKMGSSEEEGYENRISEVRGKRRCRLSGTFEESPSIPVLSISDDTDRQFWAEDELSNTESRQRLIARRKRRHSVSYRNRTAKRSRSRASHFSNSSSDSICIKILSKVRKIRRYCRCRLKPNIEKLQSVNIGKTSYISTQEPACTMNKEISTECQGASICGRKPTNSHQENNQATISVTNRHERMDDTTHNIRKVRLKKVHGPSKSKQK